LYVVLSTVLDKQFMIGVVALRMETGDRVHLVLDGLAVLAVLVVLMNLDLGY
jgi:hypothetical protein